MSPIRGASHCGLDTQLLQSEISKIHSRVAAEPDGQFPFHRGPDNAPELLGYDPGELAVLPPESTASFAGIGNPHALAPIQPGETVVDIGCGARTDLLLAARKVGLAGPAIGVEMTPSMRALALASAARAGLNKVAVWLADATARPLPDASAAVVISNGVLNLVPEKARPFAEIVRVLRPGDRLQLADIVVEADLGEEVRRNIEL
jgi:SAM-dependent methyltransferase